MSQTLKYNLPVSEGLLCENPSCKEYANWMIKPPTGGEQFYCSEHMPVMAKLPMGSRPIKLDKPGNRNPPEEPTKTDA